MVNSPPGDAGDTADLGLIPGSGRFPGGGNSNPLQYSWDSLVAQLVKNPHAMWETWVRSMGWEDSLEKGTATLSSILAWRIPMDYTAHAILQARILEWVAVPFSRGSSQPRD